jgi:hypothetical protein
MARRLDPRRLIESFQKLINREPETMSAAAVRTQDINVRSVLRRVRNQEK